MTKPLQRDAIYLKQLDAESVVVAENNSPL